MTEAVYDSPTGRILLIPQARRLIGQYDAQVAVRAVARLAGLEPYRDAERAFDRLGTQARRGPRGLCRSRRSGRQSLGRALQGGAALDHSQRRFRAGTSNDENGLVDAIRAVRRTPSARPAGRVVGRSLQVQPTITVRPGFPVRVIVTRDLVMEPYSG